MLPYIIYCFLIFLKIDLNAKSILSVAQSSNSSFSSLETNSTRKSSLIPKSIKDESSFINRYGHKVVGYKQSKTGQRKKSRKNAKELGNKLIGGDYWFAGLGFINEEKLGQIAGISISSDDEEQGLQGILSILHSKEELLNISLTNFRLGTPEFFSLDTKTYGINGALRVYDRAFLLDPLLTSVNFLQIGLGYQQYKIELNRILLDTNSPNDNLPLPFEFIRDWTESSSSKSLINSSDVVTVNITMGSEIGMKYLSLLPYLNYTVFLGDIEFSSFSYGLSLSFFYSNQFIELGISDGNKIQRSYNVSFGRYF